MYELGEHVSCAKVAYLNQEEPNSAVRSTVETSIAKQQSNSLKEHTTNRTELETQ